jgi:iron complex transport system permease protein
VLALLLVLGILGLSFASLLQGSTDSLSSADVWRGVLAWFGAEDDLTGSGQAVLLLRARRTLVALGVGASLAYAGALLQGLFRNALASPSVLGISTGASVGASIAILAVGGYGLPMVVERAVQLAPVLVTVFAFLGAMGATCLVSLLGTKGGRLSVPTLLLSGIALNTCLGGLLAAIQAFTLTDNLELAKALLSWTFGSLSDHSTARVLVVWCGLGIGVAIMPFVKRELDLFAGGEQDASALGVNVTRTKFLVLAGASLVTASAVAVAGQIAFLGLVVPHVLRLFIGSSHTRLLPLSLLAGAFFLLAADLAQRLILGSATLGPGVLMSLVGGPFFMVLLVRSRKELQTW